MKNTIYDFGKSRITAIDIQPYFRAGFKDATEFAKKHNIVLGSPDGIRVLYGYTLKHVNGFLSTHKPTFQPVLFMSKINGAKMTNFVENYLPKLSPFFKAPYCGYIQHASDVESAAIKVIEAETKKKNTKEMLSRVVRPKPQTPPAH